MIPEQLIIEGFLSYKKRQTVVFPDIAVCLVNGMINSDPSLSNGAGKSSLFEAILVNLFGKGAGRGDVLDAYINDSMNSFYTEYIFLIDKQRYKSTFIRVRDSSTKHDIHFDTVNKDIGSAKWKITDKTAEEILGLTLLTSNSTVYLNERDALKFIDGGSSDRKEILRELLNADVFELASKIAAKKADELTKSIEQNSVVAKNKQDQTVEEVNYKTSLTSIKTQTEILRKQHFELLVQVKKLEKDKNQVEVKIEKQKLLVQEAQQQNEKKKEYEAQVTLSNRKILQLEELIENTKTKIKDNETLASTLKKKKTAFKKTIAETKEKISKYDDNPMKTIKAIGEKTAQFNKQKTIDENESTRLDVQIADLQSLISRTKEFGNVCPVTKEQCPVLDDEHKEKMIQDKKEKIDELKLKQAKVTVMLKTVEEEITSLQQKQEQIMEQAQQREKLVQQQASDEKALNDAENKSGTITFENDQYTKQIEQHEKTKIELQQAIKDNKEKIETINQKIEELKQKFEAGLNDKLETLEEKYQEAAETASSKKLECDDNDKKVAVLESKLEYIKELKGHIQELLKTNDELTAKKKVFMTLASVFGKEGIQKFVISEAIPFLEQASLDLLKIFNNDSEKIKIKFDLDPKKADGDFKKQGGLDILVLDNDKPPKDLRMYSGGERVRLIFSIVLGLAKLLSKRSGKKHETLIIDEKIAKLDRRGIDQFAEVIDIISKWYKRIYIITHIESLKDMFDQAEIIVNKTDEEGSVVTVY